jgi:hypothetical protein
MKQFGRAQPCDHCNEPSVVQIITVVFDGPSPADQFLCRAHAPSPPVNTPHRTDANVSS